MANLRKAPALLGNPAGKHEAGEAPRAVRDASFVEPASTSRSRRTQPDRGAETRERLIEAGLDIFGRLGFEGATTRQIVDQAGANLAAINYHFGSKEALHVAVAERIVARIGALVGPVLMGVEFTGDICYASDGACRPDPADRGLCRHNPRPEGG